MYTFSLAISPYTSQPDHSWRAYPQNLVVGQIIGIPCAPPPIPVPDNVAYLSYRSSGHGGIGQAQLDLINEMRTLWEQHVAWTRMLIISIASDLPDEALVTKRLLRNPPDMAAVFRRYYGDEIASQFNKLFTEHLVIASRLVKAAKAGDQKAAAEEENKWYANADELAGFLSRINPNWPKEAVKAMLHEHLKLTKSGSRVPAYERLRRRHRRVRRDREASIGHGGRVCERNRETISGSVPEIMNRSGMLMHAAPLCYRRTVTLRAPYRSRWSNNWSPLALEARHAY